MLEKGLCLNPIVKQKMVELWKGLEVEYVVGDLVIGMKMAIRKDLLQDLKQGRSL